jgi:hypothetical protein
MKKYFNTKTVIYLIISVVLSLLYSYIFKFSYLSFVNGLTLLACINALIALIVSSSKKGDFSMFAFKKHKTEGLKNYRNSVIEKSKNKTNSFFGSFIILLITLIILNYIF